MKKSDIVARVAERTGMSKRDAEDAVNAILAGVEEALARGDAVRISGFGRFSLKNRRAHIGRNPATGEPMPVGVSRTPLFKAGKRLKDTVNRGGPEPGVWDGRNGGNRGF